MALEPEEMALPGLMRGLMVVVEYMRGPQVTEENLDSVFEEGEVLQGRPEARTARLHLEHYSSFGIEVATEPGAAPTYFIPWSSVLAMSTGGSREELIQRAKEDMAETEEGNPA